MKIYAVAFLLLLLPVPTDAIFAAIFGAVLGLLFGDWQGAICDSITDNLGSFSSDCPCSVGLSGFFDFNVDVECTDVASSGCDIGLGAGGNIFGAAFGGSVGFDGSTTCDFTVADVTLGLGGSVSSGGASLDSCTVEVDPAVALLVVNNCDCNLGCDSEEPFSAQLECDIAGVPNALSLPCGNVLEIIDELDDLVAFPS